jgi:multiple sugar transport system permease protein
MAHIQATETRRWTSAPKPIQLSRIVLYSVLILAALLFLFPYIWMGTSTFKSETEISAFPPTLFPQAPTMQSVIDAWEKINLKRFFINSLIVTGIVVPLSVLISAWLGFVWNKYQFRFKEPIFYLILATMMIPAPLLLIPHYQVVLWLGWLNTYQALIVPGLLTPYGIFLMRQFMNAVPDELLNAARIDGASEPRLFIQVVLPLVAPSMAALGIIQFVGNWSNLLWPLVVTTKPDLYTIPVGLATFSGEYERNFGVQNAGAFIATIPVIIAFLFFQKYIIEGISLTGLKG